MPLEFAHLTSAQLSLLPAEKTVFLFPVGPLEDHGSHLPIGLDLEEAVDLCRRAGVRIEKEMPGWVAVILPSSPLALDSNTGKIALTVRPHVLRDWLVDACRGLIRAGFFHFICFSGHLGPKQLTAIEEAGEIIRRQTRWIRQWRKLTARSSFSTAPLPYLISACSAQVAPSTVWKSPIFLDPIEHGGRRDTSVALAILPQSVQRDFANLPERKPLGPTSRKRYILHLRKRDSGYWGRPSEAAEGWGQGVLQASIDEVFPKIKAVLEGADPNLLFRSWYSIFPSNRTFFKSWLLVFAFGSILLAWMFLNLWASLGL